VRCACGQGFSLAGYRVGLKPDPQGYWQHCAIRDARRRLSGGIRALLNGARSGGGTPVRAGRSPGAKRASARTGGCRHSVDAHGEVGQGGSGRASLQLPHDRQRAAVRAAGEGPRAAGIDGECESPTRGDTPTSCSSRKLQGAEASSRSWKSYREQIAGSFLPAICSRSVNISRRASATATHRRRWCRDRASRAISALSPHAPDRRSRKRRRPAGAARSIW
jgi:hypothetical protein